MFPSPILLEENGLSSSQGFMSLELRHWSWVTMGTTRWSSALVWVAQGLPLSEIYGTFGFCSLFSVASVQCLEQNNVLVELPFTWSFCTTISLTESLLFPQQSCQEVVLWYLFILLLTSPHRTWEIGQVAGISFYSWVNFSPFLFPAKTPVL